MTQSSPVDVIHRERMVIRAMRENPGLLHPELALAAVCWPTTEFERQTLDAAKPRAHYKRQHPCRGCGGHLDVYTTGCANCAERRRIRARRAA